MYDVEKAYVVFAFLAIKSKRISSTTTYTQTDAIWVRRSKTSRFIQKGNHIYISNKALQLFANGIRSKQAHLVDKQLT